MKKLKESGMKRTILTGVLVATAGFSGLLAQQPAEPAAPKAPAVKKVTQEEQKAWDAVLKAADPDAAIKAAEELMTKFADTPYKEAALSAEAQAYKEKGDRDQAQVFAGRVLEVNPKNYAMELMLGEVIEGRMRNADLDLKENVAKCTHLFNDAIDNVKVAVKPNPTIPDAEWPNDQKFLIAQAHYDLGILLLIQKKPDDAIKEFQQAIDGDPAQDAFVAQLAKAYSDANKFAECIAACDRLLAKPDLNARIKSYVTSIKNLAVASAKAAAK